MAAAAVDRSLTAVVVQVPFGGSLAVPCLAAEAAVAAGAVSLAAEATVAAVALADLAAVILAAADQAGVGRLVNA